jgi:hypothetical protein
VLISSITACGKSVYCRNSCIPIATNGGLMLGNKKASSFRGVRSEPTPAPIKAKPAEQKYHDEDDQ